MTNDRGWLEEPWVLPFCCFVVACAVTAWLLFGGMQGFFEFVSNL